MSFSPGQRLGPYEITAAIGSGGMGEVYRGRDATLNRDVAIKVLPATMAGDSERLARFKREAQVLASLNHPNIAQIFGFDSAALQDGSTAHFLSMEMVEGEDLAERLKRGAIPVDESIAIARQIADGLEEAHEHGIIHRDLKPANIKVTPDGRVKVLDFGLAKALDNSHGEASAAPRAELVEASHSPTMSRHMTEAGMVMGTAAYMSPEQARGKPVDRRADIWSFGVVLFEMLTGARLFAGETVSDTLAAVLKTDPDWNLLPKDTPPTIKRLLRRCLERDARRRLGWIGGFRHELEEPGSLDRETALTRPTVPAWRRVLPLAAAAMAGALLVGLIRNDWGRARGGAAPVSRLTIETSAAPDDIAISPDGSRVLIRQGGTLRIRTLSGFETVPVKGVDLRGLQNIVFSPDGLSIAFSVERTLKRIPASGGVVIDVAELPDFPEGCSWRGDHIYCGVLAHGVVRVAATGGPIQQVITVPAGEHAATPQLLEGGDVLLFTMTPGTMRPDWRQARIVAQSLSSGRREVVVANGSDPRYLPSGHIAYAVAGVWFTARFDVKTLQVTGSPMPMIEGVRRLTQGGLPLPHVSVDVSTTGTLVYLSGRPTWSILKQILFADRSGRERVLALAPAEYEVPRVSPDGRRLAFSTDNRQEAAVWIYDLSEKNAIRRLTFSGRNRLPLWSPDGASVAFQSDEKGDTSIFVKNADGAGEAERLTTAPAGVLHIPESWSKDGRYLSYSLVSANGVELWLRSMSDGAVERFGDIRSNAPLNSAFSPDGKWIAYTVRGEGAQVFVQPVPPTGARYQISDPNDTGHHPFWSPSGRELFYYGMGGGTVVSSSMSMSGGVTSGRPVRVPGRGSSGSTALGPLNDDMTPDGREFVFTRNVPSAAARAAEPGEGTSIKVVLNWFEELNRLAPIKP